MGIPFFFKEIVQQNNRILTQLKGCDRLYMDYNSIIHTCSQKVVTSKVWTDYGKLERAIFTYIIDYTHEIIKACRPKQLLYIGIDGVAPLAKMIQQRKRRHLSAYQNGVINDFKVNAKIPFTQWDSNCITPGTEFMQRLNQVLKTHFASIKTPYTTIVSGSDEKGEGEHKIIRYIKDLGVDNFKDVIYGLDADLIMLSLTCHKSNIFLMREASQLYHHAYEVGFKYIDIDVLRDGISQYLYGHTDTRYMSDYVFICFLLGNDFLPHFLGVNIKYGGLDVLCDTYRKLHPEMGFIIAQDETTKMYSINVGALTKYMYELSLLEESNIKNNVKKFYDSQYVPKQFKSRLEQFVNDLTFSPLLNRRKLIDPEKDVFWKASYYKTFANIISTNIQSLDDICMRYVQGLIWNVDYYFNCEFDNSWYYEYIIAPFFSDIHKYLPTKDYDSIVQSRKLATDTTIIDKEQLLLVLPYQSFHLLPQDIAAKVKDVSNGIAYLYPQQFKIVTYMKAQLWECIPMLPLINLQKVKDIFKDQPTC